MGRSLQTPQLGEPLVNPAEEFSDHVYKVVLSIPKDLQKEIKKLVIELVVDMGKEDEMVFSTGYLFNRPWGEKTWPDAEAHCKSLGGHLASIHLTDQQALAEKVAGGEYVWLGGTREPSGEWSWSDNSTWDFANWGTGKAGEIDGGGLYIR